MTDPKAVEALDFDGRPVAETTDITGYAVPGCRPDTHANHKGEHSLLCWAAALAYHEDGGVWRLSPVVPHEHQPIVACETCDDIPEGWSLITPDERKWPTVVFSGLTLESNVIDHPTLPEAAAETRLVIRGCHIAYTADEMVVTSCPGCEFHGTPEERAVIEAAVAWYWNHPIGASSNAASDALDAAVDRYIESREGK